ncbi:MAG: hypothetical protein AAB892_01175 [Patescibacteria group bacterium]
MKTFILVLVSFVAFTSVAFARTPTQMCTMQYDPVCGAKEVQCVRAPCYPQYQTYGNACMLGNDGAAFIHKGECTPSETGPVYPDPTTPYTPPKGCTTWSDGCNTCSLQSDGNAACTLMACEGPPRAGYCIAYGTGSGTSSGGGNSGSEVVTTPSPVEPAPAATTSENVEASSEGFFLSLWRQILRFFNWF